MGRSREGSGSNSGLHKARKAAHPAIHSHKARSAPPQLPPHSHRVRSSTAPRTASGGYARYAKDIDVLVLDSDEDSDSESDWETDSDVEIVEYPPGICKGVEVLVLADNEDEDEPRYRRSQGNEVVLSSDEEDEEDEDDCVVIPPQTRYVLVASAVPNTQFAGRKPRDPHVLVASASTNTRSTARQFLDPDVLVASAPINTGATARKLRDPHADLRWFTPYKTASVNSNPFPWPHKAGSYRYPVTKEALPALPPIPPQWEIQYGKIRWRGSKSAFLYHARLGDARLEHLVPYVLSIASKRSGLPSSVLRYLQSNQVLGVLAFAYRIE
ncbi:hypothetical protein JCM10908_005131 [Rhodotorula pacifica]|uniref:uncharacterized protein n=1 Tax=Rhodotorula pacifica TaxID=1495444 RepID=UPI00317DC1C6